MDGQVERSKWRAWTSTAATPSDAATVTVASGEAKRSVSTTARANAAESAAGHVTPVAHNPAAADELAGQTLDAVGSIGQTVRQTLQRHLI